MKTRRSFLRGVPLFSDLSDEQIDQLLTTSLKRSYKKGSIVFCEKEPGDFMLLVLTGQVNIVIYGEENEELLLHKLGPGSFLGELALLDQAPRAATVITATDADFLQLMGTEFRELLKSDHRLCTKIIDHLTSRVRDMTNQLRMLTMGDVYEKILRCLVRLAKQNAKIERELYVIDPIPPQQELATMIGCSRETVNRAIRDLKTTGFIKEQDGCLRIEERALKKYWDLG